MTSSDRLGDLRKAVGHGEWQLALGMVAEGGFEASNAECLELRAQASYGNGDFEDCVSTWEELHSLHLAQGHDAEAASAATMIAMYIMMDTGLMAPVRGWLKRAQRLLDGQSEHPAHAMIAMVRTYERFMCGDMVAAREQSALAIELGSRLGVGPAVVIGRVATARIKILDGHVDEGLDLLDEVSAVLMSGEVDPLTTGMMYCELICAAQGLALHDRAREWTEVMEHWRHGAAFGGINGRCRVHRAELLRISGTCDLAEEEALAACSELRPWLRREFGWPLVELGNIRLRKGDLDGAEEAFLAAHEHAWSPQPGLALLRLAQGNPEGAAALIADAIAHPLDIPSKERPPFGDLRLAPLFDAQAEIAAEMGDADIVWRAADALQLIANAYSSRSLRAAAALAKARAALLSNDLEQTNDACSTAIAEWADLGAPFETAMARLVLGEAHHRSGNTDRALMEWRAAQGAFEAFGARRWAERAAHLVAGTSSTRSAIAERGKEQATFTCDGDTRTVIFAGVTVLIGDLTGFRYAERLLASPGREFHVLDLVAVERGSLPVGRILDQGFDSTIKGVGGGLPAIDDQAREAYRRRLVEVNEDIEEATRFNDIGRVELAERDREYLMNELKRAVGLGGRNRLVGGNSERARNNVTRSLRYALSRLALHHPPLAAHLRQNVRTGTYCVYEPDQRLSVHWQT